MNFIVNYSLTINIEFTNIKIYTYNKKPLIFKYLIIITIWFINITNIFIIIRITKNEIIIINAYIIIYNNSIII